MSIQRSDDFIDGLQTAYTMVHSIQQKAVLQESKRTCMLILTTLNEAIENASVDKPRIIVP